MHDTATVDIAGNTRERAVVRFRLFLPLYGARVAIYFGYARFAELQVESYLRWVDYLVARDILLLGVPARPDLAGQAEELLVCIAGGPRDTNTAPVANAGSDVAASLGQRVMLDGRDSLDADGDPLTYAWTLTSIPPGSTAMLDNASIAEPAFGVDVPGSYIAQLVVNDGELDSAPDRVEITTANSAPIADAGIDQTVRTGDTVTLDASGSTDIDGDFLVYRWVLMERPLGSIAVLSDANALMPTFRVDVPGRYVGELSVNDGEFDSVPDQVVVTTINSVPVADAGPDQSLPLGSQAMLDGSGSFDVDGDPLSFNWALTDVPTGSAVVLSNNMAATPDFFMDRPGAYTASLVVNDGTADSTADTVTVTTENSPPVADAGPNVAAFVGDVVELDGSGSSDADGDPLTFAWSLLSGPSTPTLNQANMERANFAAEAAGDYVAQLIVNDGTADSTPDTSMIQVSVQPVTDADNDGLSDTEEVSIGTDPNDPDTDGDGLNDGDEVNDIGTSPLDDDSDSDGFSDGEEVANGSDPADGDDFPVLPPIAVSYMYDESQRVSAMINADGGEVTLDLGGGLSATLTVAERTVLEDTEFTMTPAVTVDNLPPGYSVAAAVRLGPADAAFLKPPQLTFTLADGYRGDGIPTGFFSDDDGSGFYLTPLVGAQGIPGLDETVLTVSKTSFSTGGVAVIDGDTKLNRKRDISTREKRVNDGTVDILNDLAKRQADDPSAELSPAERTILDTLLDDWVADINRRLDLIVLKIRNQIYTFQDLDSVRNLAAEAVAAVQMSQYLSFATDEHRIDDFLSRIETAFDAVIADSFAQCLDSNVDIAKASETLRGNYYADLQYLGSETPFSVTDLLCLYELALTPSSTTLPSLDESAEASLSMLAINRETGNLLGPVLNPTFSRLGQRNIDYTLEPGDTTTILNFDAATDKVEFKISGFETGEVKLSTQRARFSTTAAASIELEDYAGTYALDYSGTATDCTEPDDAGPQQDGFSISLGTSNETVGNVIRSFSLGGTAGTATLNLNLDQLSDDLTTVSADGSASYSETETFDVDIDGDIVQCTFVTTNAFGTLSGSGTETNGLVQINLNATSAQFSYTGSPAQCGNGFCRVTGGKITLTRQPVD